MRRGWGGGGLAARERGQISGRGGAAMRQLTKRLSASKLRKESKPLCFSMTLRNRSNLCSLLKFLQTSVSNSM